MNKLSIKKKLIVLSSVLLGLLLLIGCIQFYGSLKLEQKLNDISNIQLPAVRLMTLLDMMHDSLRSSVFRAIYISNSNNKEEKIEVLNELKEFSDNMNEYASTISNLNLRQETKSAIEQNLPEIKSYIAEANTIISYSLKENRDELEKKVYTFQKAFKSLEVKLGKLGELIEEDMRHSRVEGEGSAQIIKYLSFALVVFGLFLGTVISILISQNITRTLAAVISQLSNSNHHLSSASSEIALSASDLTEASTQQSASLQETIAAIEQISAMVNQNAESSNKTKETVESSQLISEEGSQNVNEMLVVIEDIKSANDDILTQMDISNKEFSEIVRIISDIAKKTNVINEIVFQTKLLSFNASVEAARAGEHGKGFASVAEEVGNLAQMSGDAAKEISEMLSNSIVRVNGIVDGTKSRIDELLKVVQVKQIWDN